MGDVIFAVPRTDYGSYRDLYRVINLSEFPTCFIDEIDSASDNAYIITVFNREMPTGGFLGARARIVLWDLEYHLAEDNRIPPLANVELWAGDKWYAEQIGARYVPMGAHPDLRTAASANPERYDVAYLAYMTHRRQHIRNELMRRGVAVSPPGAWGEERHQVLANSTAYLVVHQHDNVPTICPLRMIVAAAYSLPVITESVADYGIFGDCGLGLDYADISENVYAWTHNTYAPRFEFLRPLQRNGQRLHQLLCHDLTFRKSVEAML